MPDFNKTGQTVEEILQLFEFLKHWTSTIFHFKSLNDFARSVRKADTHQCNRLHRNRSTGLGDIMIFLF